MDSYKESRAHGIELKQRNHMEITGVSEVVSFDELGILLKTDCGELTVEGKDIKVSVLDTDRGVINLDGRIDALYYTNVEDTGRRKFFGKLTK